MNVKENEEDREKAAQKARGEVAPGKGSEKKAQVRLNNTRPTLLHLPAMPKEPTEQQKRLYQAMQPVGTMAAPQPLTLEAGKSLTPGGNNVSTEEWERAKEHPVVQMWMEEGWIYEGDQKDAGKPEGPEPPASLKGRNPLGAQMLIDAETRRDVLEQWKGAESRDDVKQAIDRRLESIGGKR